MTSISPVPPLFTPAKLARHALQLFQRPRPIGGEVTHVRHYGHLCVSGRRASSGRQRVLPNDRPHGPRGPDGQGLWTSPVEGRVILGHRRLSILDLSQAGSQPMLGDGSRLAITFNGEIYNYKALRQDMVGRGWRFRSNSDTKCCWPSGMPTAPTWSATSVACSPSPSGMHDNKACSSPGIHLESNRSITPMTARHSALPAR
ncbi:MAG: hypothetical protein IPO28_12930 [Holophagaceae bacterium]|nr:hypothetical protein [Holophagaceae bacterium]